MHVQFQGSLRDTLPVQILPRFAGSHIIDVCIVWCGAVASGSSTPVRTAVVLWLRQAEQDLAESPDAPAYIQAELVPPSQPAAVPEAVCIVSQAAERLQAEASEGCWEVAGLPTWLRGNACVLAQHGPVLSVAARAAGVTCTSPQGLLSLGTGKLELWQPLLLCTVHDDQRLVLWAEHSPWEPAGLQAVVHMQLPESRDEAAPTCGFVQLGVLSDVAAAQPASHALATIGSAGLHEGPMLRDAGVIGREFLLVQQGPAIHLYTVAGASSLPAMNIDFELTTTWTLRNEEAVPTSLQVCQPSALYARTVGRVVPERDEEDVAAGVPAACASAPSVPNLVHKLGLPYARAGVEWSGRNACAAARVLTPKAPTLRAASPNWQACAMQLASCVHADSTAQALPRGGARAAWHSDIARTHLRHVRPPSAASCLLSTLVAPPLPSTLLARTRCCGALVRLYTADLQRRVLLRQSEVIMPAGMELRQLAAHAAEWLAAGVRWQLSSERAIPVADDARPTAVAAISGAGALLPSGVTSCYEWLGVVCLGSHVAVVCAEPTATEVCLQVLGEWIPWHTVAHDMSHVGPAEDWACASPSCARVLLTDGGLVQLQAHCSGCGTPGPVAAVSFADLLARCAATASTTTTSAARALYEPSAVHAAILQGRLPDAVAMLVHVALSCAMWAAREQFFKAELDARADAAFESRVALANAGVILPPPAAWQIKLASLPVELTPGLLDACSPGQRAAWQPLTDQALATEWQQWLSSHAAALHAWCNEHPNRDTAGLLKAAYSPACPVADPDCGLLRWDSVSLEWLRAGLAACKLAHVNGTQQFELLAIADAVSRVVGSVKLRADANGAWQFVPDAELAAHGASLNQLDSAGLVALLHVVLAHVQEAATGALRRAPTRPAGSAVRTDPVLATAAALSNTQSELLAAIAEQLCPDVAGTARSSAGLRISLDVLEQVHAPLWLHDHMLEPVCAALAHSEYIASGRDPYVAGLWWVVQGGAAVLTWAGLLERGCGPGTPAKDKVAAAKVAKFVRKDFSDPANAKLAERNAYSLLGQHKYLLSAAFFVLAKNWRQAVRVCSRERPLAACLLARLLTSAYAAQSGLPAQRWGFTLHELAAAAATAQQAHEGGAMQAPGDTMASSLFDEFDMPNADPASSSIFDDFDVAPAERAPAVTPDAGDAPDRANAQDEGMSMLQEGIDAAWDAVDVAVRPLLAWQCRLVDVAMQGWRGVALDERVHPVPEITLDEPDAVPTGSAGSPGGRAGFDVLWAWMQQAGQQSIALRAWAQHAGIVPADEPGTPDVPRPLAAPSRAASLPAAFAAALAALRDPSTMSHAAMEHALWLLSRAAQLRPAVAEHALLLMGAIGVAAAGHQRSPALAKAALDVLASPTRDAGISLRVVAAHHVHFQERGVAYHPVAMAVWAAAVLGWAHEQLAARAALLLAAHSERGRHMRGPTAPSPDPTMGTMPSMLSAGTPTPWGFQPSLASPGGGHARLVSAASMPTLPDDELAGYAPSCEVQEAALTMLETAQRLLQTLSGSALRCAGEAVRGTWQRAVHRSSLREDAMFPAVQDMLREPAALVQAPSHWLNPHALAPAPCTSLAAWENVWEQAEVSLVARQLALECAVAQAPLARQAMRIPCGGVALDRLFGRGTADTWRSVQLCEFDKEMVAALAVNQAALQPQLLMATTTSGMHGLEPLANLHRARAAIFGTDAEQRAMLLPSSVTPVSAAMPAVHSTAHAHTAEWHAAARRIAENDNAVSISCNAVVQRLASHPSEPFCVSGGVAGQVFLWKFGDEESLIGLKRWRQSSGTGPGLPDHGQRITQVTWGAHGSQVLAGDHAGGLWWWDVSSMSRAASSTPLSRVSVVLTTPGLAHVYLAGTHGRAEHSLYCTDGRILGMQCTALPLRASPSVPAPAAAGVATSKIYSGTYDEDRAQLSLGFADGSVALYDVRAQRLLSLQASSHPASVKAMCSVVPGQVLATGGNDGSVKLWDVSSGADCTLLQSMEAVHKPRRMYGWALADTMIATYGVTDLRMYQEWLLSSGSDGRVVAHWVGGMP